MRSLLVAILLTTVVLAGCANQSEDPPAKPPVGSEEAPFMPRVVVAIIDTGLQPYHHEFRQVRSGEDASLHPADYLKGYPADAQRLPITLDLDSTETKDYFEADEKLWQETGRETLYWLPGTKVVGMIGFGTDIPGSGHGTMTSSRAVGNTISIANNDTLLVNIRVPLFLPIDAEPGTAEAQAVRWSADQEWIDIQSNSWGFPAMCAGPVADSMTEWMDAFKYARDKQLVFSAVHNGHGNTGTLGYPSQCQDTAGPAGVIAVGANDNDGLLTWANWFPNISADGCRNPAVKEDTIHELANTGGGTSSATPFSAGGAAKLILEARGMFRDPRVGIRDGVIAELQEGGMAPATGPLADGKFTMDELKEVLFRTALARPTDDPSDGDRCGINSHIPLPPGASSPALYPFIGYGEVNHASIEFGVQVLRGDIGLPSRVEEDRMFVADQDVRRALWG